MARIPRLGEALGVLALSLSFIVALSLLSHTPGDPSFFSQGAAGPARNLVGRTGATLSEALLQVFGLGAYFLVLAGGWLGGARLFGREGPSPLASVVGFGGMLAGLLPLLHLLLGEGMLGGGLDAGGILGSLLGGALAAYLNVPGAALLSLTVLAACAVVSTQVSYPDVLRAASALTASALRKGRTALARLRENRRREKMQKQVILKQAMRQQPATGGAAAPPVRMAPRSESRAHPAGSASPGGLPGAGSRSAAAGGSPPAPPRQSRLPIGPGHLAYTLPPTTILQAPPASAAVDDRELFAKAKVLTEKCREFGVDGAVIEIHPGPVVTTFEFKPDAGIKYSKITSLADDLCLAMEAESVRIDRVSGKSTVGIEVPNAARETIFIREVIESEKFQRSPSKLTLALGKRIDGEVYLTDLAKMPHLLIAGATGAGKSVTLNSIIASILYRATPDEVKFIFIDTKRLELGLYENIPHLLTPVVVEPKKASNALKWATLEMERRYKLLAECGVRSIDQYNGLVKQGRARAHAGSPPAEGGPEIKPLPYVLVVIDELADLMILAAAEIEESITRLAQMARAVGIHLVLSTQRPSVDVLTGVIKANLPSRIALRVSSKVDSRTIIDGNGAEKLLGNGDMLFLPPGSARLLRVHGSYISDTECQALAEYLRKQARPSFDETVTVEKKEAGAWEGEMDSMFPEAVRMAIDLRQVSASHLQRRLRLGYARAARLVDMMEARGIVGPADGSRPREVLVGHEFLEEMAARKA